MTLTAVSRTRTSWRDGTELLQQAEKIGLSPEFGDLASLESLDQDTRVPDPLARGGDTPPLTPVGALAAVADCNLIILGDLVLHSEVQVWKRGKEAAEARPHGRGAP
jgi:hypothetical protein